MGSAIETNSPLSTPEALALYYGPICFNDDVAYSRPVVHIPNKIFSRNEGPSAFHGTLAALRRRKRKFLLILFEIISSQCLRFGVTKEPAAASAAELIFEKK